MAIEFHCPRCQTRLTVPDEEAGKKQRCPGCRGKLRVPAPNAAEGNSPNAAGEFPPFVSGGQGGAGEATAATARPGMTIEFLCPRCHVRLTVPAEDAGKKQRCPSCQGKLRVPAPEGADGAPGAAGAMAPHAPVGATIEFQCPRCQAPLSVPWEDAGKKLRCLKCRAKLRVPVPEGTGSTGQGGAAAPPAQGLPTADVLGLESAGVDDSGEYLVGQRVPQFNLLGLFIPFVCVAFLAAVAAWLLHKPEPKLEGTLTGERLNDVEFGPTIVDNRYLGRPKPEARNVFSSLESSPLRAVSQLLVLEFEGSPSGISVLIRAADGCEFYRFDPRGDKVLSKYLDKEQERLTAALESELKQAVPEFLKAIEKRPEGTHDVEGLVEFRNSVGLASLLKGFGFHIQAVIDKQVYPCVREDDEGRLYFSLPVNTQEFELVGREISSRPSRKDKSFAGHYQVSISGEPVTVNKKKLDAKERVREQLRK